MCVCVCVCVYIYIMYVYIYICIHKLRIKEDTLILCDWVSHLSTYHKRKVLSHERLGAKLRVTENWCVLFNSLTCVYLALLPQYWARYAKVDSTPTFIYICIHTHTHTHTHTHIYIYIYIYICRYVFVCVRLYIWKLDKWIRG